jgi:hypothetical protein
MDLIVFTRDGFCASVYAKSLPALDRNGMRVAHLPFHVCAVRVYNHAGAGYARVQDVAVCLWI